jgi:hypothetical protein
LENVSTDDGAMPVVDLEGEELMDIGPMRKKCKYCENEVVTYVEHETSPVFYLFILFSMFIFGWTFIFLVPFAYLLLKNAVHRCSRCLNEIGTRHMFGIPDFNQEILVFQLGKCSIIISRTVGVAIFAAFTIVFLYFSWFYDFGMGEEGRFKDKKSIVITASWEDFIDECGSNVVIVNNVKATEIFKNKYQNNVVNWGGYYIDSKNINAMSFTQNSHAMNLFIKMEPSETVKEADIVLSLTNSVYNDFKETIDSLKTGDHISFSAKFISLGDEFQVNHLHAHSIVKTGRFKSLPDIVITETGMPKSIPHDAHELPESLTPESPESTDSSDES